MDDVPVSIYAIAYPEHRRSASAHDCNVRLRDDDVVTKDVSPLPEIDTSASKQVVYRRVDFDLIVVAVADVVRILVVY